jgi:hypothetical protein
VELFDTKNRSLGAQMVPLGGRVEGWNVPFVPGTHALVMKV